MAWRRSGIRSLAGLALVIACQIPLRMNAAVSQPDWHFIPGAPAAEDIVAVPGTRWLIASALNLGRPAPLALVDGRTTTAEPLHFTKPSRASPDASCPTPPDPTRMSTDGLAIGPGKGGSYRLFAANHGDRRAIEMFRLELGKGRPTLAWENCALMPAGTLPNAVASLPDGGLLMVSFHDPDDPQAWARMARGENTGKVLEWRPGQGFRTVPDSAMSGGNGIALSRDGATAYVSAWSGRKLVALSLKGGGRREIPLDFLPDNIHALPDGSLLVGGQRTDVLRIAACTGPQCPQPWLVARVDPEHGTTDQIASGPGDALVNYACGALIANGRLYITSRGSGGIAYRPVPIALQEARP